MEPRDLIGRFQESDFSRFRTPTIDTMIWGRQRHHARSLSVLIVYVCM